MECYKNLIKTSDYKNLNKKLLLLQKKLKRLNLDKKVKFSLDVKSVILEGDVSSMEERIKVGYAAARCGFKGVVNDLTINGKGEEPIHLPKIKDSLLEDRDFDTVIIGGGVIGCSIARELSRYDLKIALFEKESDVAMQASGHNDGMIHPGFADNPKKVKGRFNTRGNRMYTKVSEELGFEIKRCGSFFLFYHPVLKLLVPLMKRRCRLNGVDGDYGYVSRKKVKEKDPFITDKNYGGLWLPSAGIASPMKVTICYAENAAENGVEFFFNTALTGVKKDGISITELVTNRGTCRTKLLINAAGVWADKVAGFAGDRFFSIHARKGTDAILDKKLKGTQKTGSAMPSLLKLSKGHSKGGGIMPCVEGNLLIGPNAVEVMDREDFSTKPEDLDEIKKHLTLNSKVSPVDIITYYSGIRACTWEEDFIVEASERVENLVHAAGIQSPGFASAPAIAEDIVKISVSILKKKIPVNLKENFSSIRKILKPVSEMNTQERHALIGKNPQYGKIVCRCEQVSEGEIRNAVNNPLNVFTLDGIKRRVRTGAGRCHGGFCTPYILKIISEEKSIPVEKLTKKGEGSEIVLPIEAFEQTTLSHNSTTPTANNFS